MIQIWMLLSNFRNMDSLHTCSTLWPIRQLVYGVLSYYMKTALQVTVILTFAQHNLIREAQRPEANTFNHV